jgi:hypothetical protein
VPSASAITFEREVAVFWNKIRQYAYKLRLETNLPLEYRMMNETLREL